MKPIIFIFIFIHSFPLLSQVEIQHRCLSSEKREHFQQNNPNAKEQLRISEQKLKAWISSNSSSVQQRSIITIPVVVHIVWHTSEENIPDEQILSQIEALNLDYRSQNLEIPDVPNVFQPLIADVELEFCLAQVDPNGQSTNGITRTFTNNPVGIGGTTNIHYDDLGGKDAWDSQHYLNIWVAKFAGGIGGIATFPGQAIPEEDGVQVNYRQFGTENVTPPYHLGRTLTHEIGHYLNLEHPWGPSISDCCEDDFVADTPESCETYIGECPQHPTISCSEPDLFMNYMFYTDDDCMAMFTEGQKMRMLATLNTLRMGLLETSFCQFVGTNEAEIAFPIRVFQNPAINEIQIQVLDNEIDNWKYSVYDVCGKLLFSEKIMGTAPNRTNIDGLSSGIYFVKFELRGHFRTVKVVFNRL